MQVTIVFFPFSYMKWKFVSVCFRDYLYIKKYFEFLAMKRATDVPHIRKTQNPLYPKRSASDFPTC